MLSVLRQRNFALLWFGQLISNIGDWVIKIALPYYTYQLTGSVLATGSIFLASVLPGVFLGSVAGVFVDRWSRKWTMIGMDLVRTLLFMTLLAVHSASDIWIIYTVSVLDSVCGLFFSPAKSAIIPSLVGEQHLIAANSLNGIGDNLPRLVGPLLGGVLLNLSGNLTSVTCVDSITFLFSGLMIFLITAPSTFLADRTRPIQTSIGGALIKVWQEWIDGLHVVKTQQFILILFIVIGITGIADSPLTVLLSPFVEHNLHSNAVGMSWILVGQGIGGLLGAWLVAQLSKRVPLVLLMLVSLLATGLTALIIANVPVLPVSIACITFVGICVMQWAVSFEMLLQQHTADAYRGRVFGTFGNIASLLSLGVLILVSATGDYIGTIPWLTISGLLYLLTTAIGAVKLRDFLFKKSDHSPESLVSSQSPIPTSETKNV